MNVPLSNLAVEALSPELADELTQPILEAIEFEEDDEVASAVIGLIRAVAREESPELRAMFVRDVATKIYSVTNSCRHAAAAFAA